MTVTTNKKKRAAAFGVAGLMAIGLIAGGASASLSQTISDGTDTHHIYSDEVVPFDFQYHVSSSVIEADLSLVDTMSFGFSSHPIVVENIGSISANHLFYVDPAVQAELDLDNPIWDQAYAKVIITTSTGTDTWVGTVREFMNTAFVSDHVLEAGESTAYVVQFLAPSIYSWHSEEGSDAVDVDFGTRFLFNQLTTPASSPMLDYVRDNGDQRNGVYWDSEADGYDPSWGTQLVSSMDRAFTIPVSEIVNVSL